MVLSCFLAGLRWIVVMILFCGGIVLFLLSIAFDNGKPLFVIRHLDSLQMFGACDDEMAMQTPPVAVAANNSELLLP